MPDLPEASAAGPPPKGHVVFENLLAELSARFLTLPTADVDTAITDALRRIASLLEVDRTQLIRFERPRSGAHVTHSGAVQGIAEGAPDIALTKAFPWAIARLLRGEITAFARLDELPPEAAADKTVWQRYGVKSELVVPLWVDGRVDGAIVLDCDRAERAWPPDVVERVLAMTTIFGNALAHKQARESLDAAMRFERTATAILVRLLAAPQVERDAVLEAGLREVAQAFGAERATLWRRVGTTTAFTMSHHWLADGLGAPPDPRAPTVPWINAQIGQSSVVRFARHADLPPDAAADLEALRLLHIGAAVVVPLELSGTVVGALSIATTREHVQWPDALVPRVQLLGTAFASLLARQQAERREQEAQAQAAHAARVGTMGVFAASLVHELTQPLAASLANAETAAGLLDAPAPDLHDLRTTIADIVADSRRGGEMIQKLRRFLRHGEAERAEFDLRGLQDDVLRFVKAEAANKGIEITLDVPQTSLRIFGDRVQIQQVLLNLVLNAFDAVASRDPEDRRVQVRARPSETGVSIEVHDCGVGMDEVTLARVFQPFFTTKPGGMGLGLSISQTLIAAHGGTLSVRSEPGQGSTFRIELPSHQPLVIEAPQRAVVSASAADTVFVIDDNDAMRRAIERQLQAEGYRIEAFANAHAFLDRAAQARVACIVCDIRMPGLSGLELQATLARGKLELPIVFISGHADIATSVQAMKGGAVAFLPKPFAKAELLAAVSDALGRSRERDQERQQDADVLARFRSLKPREREVFELVVAGLLNKTIAQRLGIAEPTVKIHRGRVMAKMRADSVADLVRIAERVALHIAPDFAPDQTRRPPHNPS
jgi:FixJ family two-component response regulator/signal transduction histidine kinase